MSYDDPYALVKAMMVQNCINSRYFVLSDGLAALEASIAAASEVTNKECHDSNNVPLTVTRECLEGLLSTLNTEVFEKMDMVVDRSIDQVLEVPVYVLKNKVGDESAKIGTRYNAAQVEFIKAMLEVIFEENSSKGGNNGRYSFRSPSEVSQKMTSTDRLSSQEARLLVEDLVDEGWLTYSEDRHEYTPSMRLLAELGPNLIERFGPEGSDTLGMCTECKRIVTHGKYCRKCQTLTVHYHCYEKMTGEDQAKICKKCEQEPL